MDSSYIMAFVDTIQNVFSMMLQLEVQTRQPVLKQEDQDLFDVSGIIGLSGDVTGSVVLSFPVVTAERVVSIFAGSELAHTHEDFPDAVGELVNMIAGGAKAKLTGKNVSISCPTVVTGAKHKVCGHGDVVSILIPCESDCGQFVVEVSIQQPANAKNGEETPAAARAGV